MREGQRVSVPVEEKSNPDTRLRIGGGEEEPGR
jgi:hypothetical protein